VSDRRQEVSTSTAAAVIDVEDGREVSASTET
jgi:hypothetical protein